MRTNLFDFFALFDFPNAATPVGRRTETTIPTQALWMLNSSFMLNIAEKIAKEALQNPAISSDRERLGFLFLKVMNRPVSDSELADHLAWVDRLKKASIDSANVEQSVWSIVCHTLLMSNEFLYLD